MSEDSASAAGPGDRPGAFGAYLRTQRQLARLSLRQLARITSISDPYLSQIERGLHQPSVAVIRSIAEALELSAEELLAHAAGITDEVDRRMGTEAAIRADRRLTKTQKEALLAVYRSMVTDRPETPVDEPAHDPQDSGAAASDSMETRPVKASRQPARKAGGPPG